MRYKSEGVSKGMSMQAFCSVHNIPYNAFEKYLKLRRHFSTAHKIKVTDIPAYETPQSDVHGDAPDNVTTVPGHTGDLRIMIDIRMSNGIHFRQKNLDYNGLKGLVEKLEVLC